MEHDDVIKWKHFPRYWPFVREIHRSPVNFPHKGQWRGALMFTLICARMNGWVNNREAGDLRRYLVHYDVIVMMSLNKICHKNYFHISQGPISQNPCLLRSHRSFYLWWWYPELTTSLTHLPLDKMATILADDNFKCNLLNENERISIRISLKFVLNKLVLVQVKVMAQHRTGDKPLPELILTQATDAYMQH